MSVRWSVVVLLVGVGAFVLAGALGDGRGGVESLPGGEEIVPAFDPEDVALVELASPEGSFAIVRTESGWGMLERGGFPVYADRVDRLLLDLTEITPIEARTDDPAFYARLGVAAPDVGEGGGTRVVLRDAGGIVLADVLAGRVVEARGLYGMLVRRANDDRVWWIEEVLPAAVGRANWVDNAVMDIDPARVDRVRIAHPDGASVVLSAADRDRAGVVPMFVEDPPGASGDHPALLRLPGALRNLGFRDVGPAEAVPFPEGAAVVTEFETGDGLVIEVRTVALNPESVAARFRAISFDEGAGDEAAALNARLGDWVYLISAERGGDMRLRPGDLR